MTEPKNNAKKPGPLTVVSRRAMATDFSVTFNDEPEFGREESTTEKTLDALDAVERCEERLSVFRPMSEVSRVNALAAEMDVPISSELFDLLVLCRELWGQTDGAFDITCGPLWQAWGFARGEGGCPTARELAAAKNLVGMEHVRLDSSTQRVAFDCPGVSIDFGGVGKGAGIDAAAERLIAGGVADFLVEGGKSSVRGVGGRRGERSSPTGREIWSVGLVDPLRPPNRRGEFWLADIALSTSGSGRQFFLHKGKRLSHIIDPRSGEPSVGLLSVTLFAERAVVADALSTALFVLGPDRAESFCQNHPEIAAVMILSPEGSVRGEIVSFNVSPEMGVFS